MKKYLLLFLLAFGFSVLGLGQAIIYEDFNYTPPAYIGGNTVIPSSSNNWTTHSGSGGTIDVIAGNLSYPGLAVPSGYELYLFSNNNATSRDVNRAFTSTATVLYYSALINIVDNSQISSSTPDYFMHFGATSGQTVSIFSGRLGIKSVNTGANYHFSILNTSGGTPVFTDLAQDLNFGTTYLVVVKVDRSTSPITAYLWVNPACLGGTEPTPMATNNSGTGAFATFASICLRNSATTPKADIDEIRVGATWADVTATGTITAPTTQTSGFTFSNIAQTQMDVSWAVGNGYKRVVKMNTTNSFTIPADGTDPTASTVYTGGEQVIYNGSDNALPTVTGLTSNTTYWFKAWEYNGTCALTKYSAASGTNNPKSQATAGAPTAPLISSPTVTSIKSTSATLGGNITSDGGSAILERGTVWSLTTPVFATDHKLAEGGTALGVFSQVHSGMPANTLIHYAAYAKNSVGTRLSDEDTFTTLPGEPTNHVTSFSATSPTYSSITLTWSDNDGAQPATGYLILANTSGTFGPPVDGVPVTNDFVLNDGSAAVNVNHGVQTFSFYSLYSSTPYYFTIYPYTNSGTDIDYKTTIPVPTTSVTTLAFSAPVAAWTFDLTPAAKTPLTVAADFGDQVGTAMLYADGSNGSSLWDTVAQNQLTTFGGTTINDPREGASIIAGEAYSPRGGTSLLANGKSMVFKFSMTALQNAVVSFAVRGTATGFTTHQWEWSTDGSIFTSVVGNTADNSASFVLKTLDLSGVTQLNGAATVYLRITLTGAADASGNNRLDNVVIRALPYNPLPVNYTVLGAVLNGQSPCYNASQVITVGGTGAFTVASGGYAHMIAGSRIDYLPGTKVSAGGRMWGQILVSGPWCPGPEKSAEVVETGLNLMNNSFKIYPNPTSGAFTIEQLGQETSDHVKVEVMGTLGKTVLTSDMQGLRKQELSIKGNPAGIYFVKVTAGEKAQIVKIILTK